MLIKFSDFLSIEDGVDVLELFENEKNLEFNLVTSLKMYDEDVKIYLQGKTYDVLPMRELYDAKGTDGKYHAIYIWINYDTGEYYIGKVNRSKWETLRRYTGSGVVFVPKYAKHHDRFRRFYLFAAKTNEESEKLEAKIVNKNLLKDPFCLNKMVGGGGGRISISEEQKKKQSEYMKAHPEQYRAMLEAAKNLDVIEKRNKKIAKTMSNDKYKEMTRTRIKNWKMNHPDEYKKAREKNLLSINNPETKRKASESRKKWKLEHPDEFKIWEENRKKALAKPESKQKRKDSLNLWKKENPEAYKARQKKMLENCIKKKVKPVLMIDLKTRKIIRRFDSTKDAANWIIEKGMCKGSHPQNSISRVCLKKKIPGHGESKSAFGYYWEFAPKK